MCEGGEIDAADYSKRYAMYNAQFAEIETALGSSADELDVDESWSDLEHLLCNLPILWNQSDAGDKRRFGRLIYPDGLACSKRGFGTPVTSSIFTVIGDISVPRKTW